MNRRLEVTDKELVLLYMLLQGRGCPDEGFRTRFLSKVEKTLFDFMTIEQVEHIDDFFRSL